MENNEKTRPYIYMSEAEMNLQRQMQHAQVYIKCSEYIIQLSIWSFYRIPSAYLTLVPSLGLFAF